LTVIAAHQKQLEAQMMDLQANLDELKVHQRDACALLAKNHKRGAETTPKTTGTQHAAQ
jgi:hypothetical protein